VDPSAQDNKAICKATEKDRVEIIKVLLTDIRVWYKTLPKHPLIKEAWSRSVQTLLLVLDRLKIGQRLENVLRDLFINESS